MSYLAFTAPLARLVQRGEKTQTRRPLRPVPVEPFRPVYSVENPNTVLVAMGPKNLRPDGRPYFHRFPDRLPDSFLWLREPAICLENLPYGRIRLRYLSDGTEAVMPWPGRLKPVREGKGLPNGCHAEAARTFLIVRAFRVERLQTMTEADAHAEGCADLAEFRRLWDSLYSAETWESNPWVSVTTFALEKT